MATHDRQPRGSTGVHVDAEIQHGQEKDIEKDICLAIFIKSYCSLSPYSKVHFSYTDRCYIMMHIDTHTQRNVVLKISLYHCIVRARHCLCYLSFITVSLHCTNMHHTCMNIAKLTTYNNFIQARGCKQHKGYLK